jgi:spore coat polysaccharide biosynthesis predicted glycosyltransferase SpsG/CMP-N-acetylneuraminic acid synthetase
VLARGTEPRLPKKNFKRLAGRSLVAHSVASALACDRIEDVFVSTESEALAELAREHGARVPFLRPERLASAGTLLHEVASHAVDRLDAEGAATVTDATPVVLLQSNVPFRRPRDVTTALERFEEGHEAVISVVERREFYWRRERTGAGGRGEAPGSAATGATLERRFDGRAVTAELEPFYRETGSINVTTPRLLERGTRVGDSPGYVVTDRLSALAVDSVLDLWMAERLAEGPGVVFRVDGGDELGMGHVSRCLTLAAELDARLRCDIRFVTDASRPAGAEAIRDAGYPVRAVDGVDPLGVVAAMEPDVVFLDVLDTALDRVRSLHERVAAVISLEDSEGGPAHADFVVNALSQEAADGPNQFAGADYFVLREEFRGAAVRLPATAERVLFTFGGSDPRALSVLACRAVSDDADRDYRLVVGPDFDSWDALEDALADCPAVETLEDVDDLSRQMAWADLAVSSGGRTVFELAATGTPTLVVAQNDREHARMTDLDERGVVEHLGQAGTVSPERLRAAIDALAADRDRRRALSEHGRAFVDGRGTRRILDLVHDVLFG